MSDDEWAEFKRQIEARLCSATHHVDFYTTIDGKKAYTRRSVQLHPDGTYSLDASLSPDSHRGAA